MILWALIVGCSGPQSRTTTDGSDAGAAVSLDAGPNLVALRPGHGPPRGAVSLEALLSTHGIPTEAQWRALPSSVDAKLAEIATDPSGPVHRRARAMSGLAIRRVDGGASVLAASLGASVDPMLRRTAIRGLATGWLRTAADAGAGAIEPRVLAALGRALADPDALVREAAVKALAPYATAPSVHALLRMRLTTETSEMVREALTGLLGPG